MQTEIIYKLPDVAASVCLCAVMLSVACLAVWLAAGAINNFIDRSARFEEKRAKSETKALNAWKEAYDEEHALHLQDIADLSAQLDRAERDVERMRTILAKAKVADL